MFKNMKKYDTFTVFCYTLIFAMGLVGAILVLCDTPEIPVKEVISIATPDEATPDEATPDEVLPETEVVEIIDIPETTECTSAPVEDSLPPIEEIIPTEKEEEVEKDTSEKKPDTNKVSSNKTSNKTSNKNNSSNSNSTSSNKTSTPDEPTKGKMSETEMLACVIYQEVGGSKHCDECRRRVADVVLNRVADSRFPNTIEGVLTAKNQYGRFYYTGIKWADRHTWPGEKKAVERAWRIAEEVMAGKHSDLYGKGYVWQAGFKQGTSGFWCCGHYFAKGDA